MLLTRRVVNIHKMCYCTVLLSLKDCNHAAKYALHKFSLYIQPLKLFRESKRVSWRKGLGEI
jgi:hypothetical protein